MTKGGEASARRDEAEAIRALLEIFDHDPVAAVHAIRDYVQDESDSQSQRASLPLPAGPVLLSGKDITKSYKLGKQKLDVLRGITLDIHEGEFIAITGASGSGKSTLLQLMGGLDKPTSGEIWFGNKNLAKLSDGKLSDFRLRTIGFVFQFFYLQPFLQLERNLEVPGMFARVSSADRKNHVAKLAEQVGLDDRLKHLPKELSGGQMQRAAIARALANRPKILLADEPTGNLDSKNGAAIIALFETIRQELGTTVVIVTHDPAIARRADREIRLKDGLII